MTPKGVLTYIKGSRLRSMLTLPYGNNTPSQQVSGDVRFGYALGAPRSIC